MSFKTNVDSQLRGFWFAPNGSDNNSGESLEVPKLTIQAAIDAAGALVPPPSEGANQATCTAAQGGPFTDSIVCIDATNIDCTSCSINVTAPITVTLASSMLFQANSVTNSQANGTCFKVDGKETLAIDILFMGVLGEDGIGMSFTGLVSDLFSSTRLITISGDNGIGYDIQSTSNNPIDIKVDIVNLSSDGAMFLNYDPVNSTDELVINVSTIQSNIGTNTIGFTASTGRLVVESTGIFQADTVLHVKSGAVVDFNAAHVHGDIIVDAGGTLNALILEHASGVITNNGTINGNIGGRNYGGYIERPTGNVIFIHANGDDSNSGLTPNAPLQTIGEAITLAEAMLPTIINQVLIEIIDNGIYIETFELPSFVSLIGENAVVDGRITVLDNTILKLKRAENSANSSQPVIRKTSGTGFSDIKLTSLIVVGNNQEGVLCSSGMIDFTSDFVDVDAGTGLKAKLGAEMLFSVSEVSLTNSGLALGTRTSDGGPNKLIGFVRDATDDGTGVLVETRVPGDIVNIQGGTFNVNTLFDIGETGTLNAFANEANGARIAHATATVNITNHNSDSRHAGNFSLGGVYQSDQATLILADKTIDTTGDSDEDNFVLRYDDSTNKIELQPGYSIEKIVLNGFDTNNQEPVGTDNPLQVTFGAAQFGPTDPVQLSASGAITVNQSDQYNMLVVFQYGRTGAAGGSTILFFRVLINGVQFGRSLYADLDNPNQAFPVEFTTPVDLLATDVLTVEIWRDSLGFDAGELIPKTPTLGGTNSSPSAAITLTRNRLVQPI